MRNEVEEVEFAADLKQGWLLLDERRSWQAPYLPADSTFRSRVVDAFDGKSKVRVVYAMQYPQGFESPTDAPHSYLRGGGTLKPGDSPWHLVGLETIEGQLTLATLLDVPAIREEGRDSVDGVNCHRLSAAFNSSRATVWLDPTHDYLPRRIEFEMSADNSPPPLHRAVDSAKGRSQWVIRTTKYREVDDDAREGKRWFPEAGRIERGGYISEIEVLEVKVNSPLQRERFQFAVETMPDGVMVSTPPDDAFSSVSPTRFTGDRKDLYDAVQKLMDDNDERLAALRSEAPPPKTDLIDDSGVVARVEDASKPRSFWDGTWRFAAIAVPLVLLFLVVARRLFSRHENAAE